jgi:uncharacterized membrane protein
MVRVAVAGSYSGKALWLFFDAVTILVLFANSVMSKADIPCFKRKTAMTPTRKLAHAALAGAFALSSAAAIAATAPVGSKGGAIGSNDTVHCYGVHSCKGQADCATAENECRGHNECKGHGFKAMKAGECLTKGGVIGDLK